MGFFINLLTFFYSFTHSWGWAIIVLTVIIKMALFPTTLKQFRVMAKMKVIQPKLKEIQDKYKDKPEEFQRRTMEIYKAEKVNPFSGCLPMFIQIPILMLFYNALQNPHFTQYVIKNADFYGMILRDKHNLLLAILSAVTTFLQQKLTMPMSSSENDQQQQIFLYFMPLMFGWFTWQINAGIGLYWVASNIIGIIQQYVINEYFIVKQHMTQKTEEEKDPQ